MHRFFSYCGRLLGCAIARCTGFFLVVDSGGGVVDAGTKAKMPRKYVETFNFTATRPKPALALAPLEPPSKGTLVSRTLRTPPSTPQRAEAGDTLTAHAGRWVTGEMLVHLSRQGDPPGWGGTLSAGLEHGLQRGYSSPVEVAELQERSRSSRAAAAGRRP